MTPTTDEQLPELPDSVRVPLDELWADAEYLITRVVDKTLDQAAFVALIKQRINDGKNAAREAIAAVVAERDALKGLVPDFPPYPPEGHGLPRYGLRWNGEDQPLSVPMDDGYWVPWHLTDALRAERDALRADADRYRWLRDKIGFTGNGDGTSSMFALNLPMRVAGFPEIGEHAKFVDTAIDAAMKGAGR